MGAGGQGSPRVVEDGVFRGEGLGTESITKGQPSNQSHLHDEAATKTLNEGARSASGWGSTSTCWEVVLGEAAPSPNLALCVSSIRLFPSSSPYKSC